MVSVVLVASEVLVALADPVELAELVGLAVPVVPAIPGNTIRPIEVVLRMVIALPQINSAARRGVIH